MLDVITSTFVMPGRSRSNGRQVHPKGPLRTVDDTLRRRVREALETKGWDQKDLADELEVARATITNLLKPGEPRQIKYLPELLRKLGLEDDLDVVVSGWPDVPMEERALIVALVAKRRRAK